MSKEKFISEYNDIITREGADKLLAWLEQSDFFTAPASTKYHSAHEGGLCEHSLNVLKHLTVLNSIYKITENGETLAIVALLHDLCKVGFYKTDMRNVKDESGAWKQVPYYVVDDQFPYGHGEKSVYMIGAFMKLTREEAMAIRWHMGLGEDYAGRCACQAAFQQYPLAQLLHISDMLAANFEDREGK